MTIEKLHILDTKSNALVEDGLLKTTATIKSSAGNEVIVNDSGQLHTVMRGKLDTGNSTLVNLGIDEVFTGTSIDTLDYSSVTISVYSDVASATDGLEVQYSMDELDWHDGECYTIVAGANKFFTPTLQSKYMRVVYTNGGVATTDFHIHTTLRKVPQKWSSHNIDDSITDQDDAELVKSVQTGKDPNGTYRNVNVSVDGDMTISDNSSGLAIAQGKVTGTSFISKFGQNENIGTGAFEDIWDVGGLYTWPADNTAPITHLNATAGNTQDIEVQGLDINGNLLVQTKSLNGATLVALDTPLWRVFRLRNQGSVDITGTAQAINAGNTVTYAQIQNGNNQTLMALFTIPAGKTGYLVMGGASIVGLVRAYSIDGHFSMRPFGGVFQLKHTFGVSSDGTSKFQHEYKIPLPIEEKTDLRVSAISSTNGGVLNSTFDVVLVDN